MPVSSHQRSVYSNLWLIFFKDPFSTGTMGDGESPYFESPHILWEPELFIVQPAGVQGPPGLFHPAMLGLGVDAETRMQL